MWHTEAPVYSLSSPAQSGKRHEADHSHLTSAKNKDRTYISTFPYDFPTHLALY